MWKRSDRFCYRCYSTTQSASSDTRSEETTSESSQDGGNTESPSSRGPRIYIKKKAATVPSARPQKRASKPGTTVTRSEREIFDRLFAKLGSSPPPELAPGDKRKEEQKQKETSPSTTSSTTSSTSPLSDSDTDESAQISAIFQESIEELKTRANQEPGSHAAPASTSQHLSDIERLKVNQVYRKLDRFATSTAEDYGPDQVETSRLIQLVVQRESEKIENELRQTIREGKGDLGLWKVCEERIFGMLRQLDEPFHPHLSDSPEPADGRDSKDTDAEGSKDPEKSASEQQPLDIPPFVPKNAVISAVYSNMLLVVFHLLRRNFPNSPLIGEIRPTIQSYGRASVVLGASTKLYNEMIRYYWRDCDDLATVVSLLKEMEETGVEPDTKTYRLVRAIITQRERAKLKYMRQHEELRKSAGQELLHDNGATTWMEAVPNMHAYRELVGSVYQQSWADRIRLRLEELGVSEALDRNAERDLERLYSEEEEEEEGREEEAEQEKEKEKEKDEDKDEDKDDDLK